MRNSRPARLLQPGPSSRVVTPVLEHLAFRHPRATHRRGGTRAVEAGHLGPAGPCPVVKVNPAVVNRVFDAQRPGRALREILLEAGQIGSWVATALERHTERAVPAV